VVQTGNYRLILDEASNSPREFELTQPEIIIGRDPSVDITISSEAVSRRHAKLTRSGEAFFLEDLGSSNGTYLNGTRLVARQPLMSGDKIRLGQAVNITYMAPVVVPSAPAPRPDADATIARSAHGMQTIIGDEPSRGPGGSPPQLSEPAGASSKTYTLTGRS
jgi:predicted component of type VI protein secretion system